MMPFAPRADVISMVAVDMFLAWLFARNAVNLIHWRVVVGQAKKRVELANKRFHMSMDMLFMCPCKEHEAAYLSAHHEIDEALNAYRCVSGRVGVFLFSLW